MLVLAISPCLAFAQPKNFPKRIQKEPPLSVWEYQQVVETLSSHLKEEINDLEYRIEDVKDVETTIVILPGGKPFHYFDYDDWMTSIGKLRKIAKNLREIAPLPKKLELADKMLVRSSYEFEDGLNALKQWAADGNDRSLAQAKYKFASAESMRDYTMQELREILGESKYRKKYAR